MILTRPQPSTPREFRFPEFGRSTLPNGMRLVVAPMQRLPVVTAILVIDGGAMAEGHGKEGVSDIVARSLAEGTHQRSADELVMALERLGTSIAASSDWETTILKMTVMSPNIGNALSLLSEMVSSPRFEEQSIERIRSERLSEIIQSRSEPRVLADEMFAASLYDKESRYAIPVAGSGTSVAAIDPEDVRAYHTSVYRPAATTLIIAGDISDPDAQRLAASSFGQWTSVRGGEVPARKVRESVAPKKIHIVDRSGAQQSELRMGHIGVPRSVPEYFPVVVMNAVFGGLFSSRINLNLREVHGYTYGASSYFDWRKDKGPFVISTAVQTEVTGAAITQVLNEVERIRNSEIDESELSLATSYLAGVFPIRYETSDAVASGLASLIIFNLPDEYFTSYRTHILAVSTREVQQAARAFLKPEALKIVVVGNPTLLEPQLRALAIGPVEVTRAD